jgi:ribosome maturation factor RimP
MGVIANHNPRNLREKYTEWLGKRVTVGLTTFHYLSGTWKAIDGYDAVFEIGGREQRVALDEVANVALAPHAQSDYFK